MITNDFIINNKITCLIVHGLYTKYTTHRYIHESIYNTFRYIKKKYNSNIKYVIWCNDEKHWIYKKKEKFLIFSFEL